MIQNKTTLYIAMSLDGFISGENDNLDFLNPYHVEGEDYGYTAFVDSIQTVIVGRKTYEVIQGMGVPYHSEKQVFVISKDPQTSPHSNIHFFKGNVKELITQLKSNSNHNIYCDGGSQLANNLIQEGLIDEIIVSVAPIYLNKGTLLFEAGKVPKDFELLSTKEFSSGLVQYHYVLKSI
jgi:dihydrofolate reductase